MGMHLDEKRGHFVQELAPTNHERYLMAHEVVAVDLGPVLHIQTRGAHLTPVEARELATALIWWADRQADER